MIKKLLISFLITITSQLLPLNIIFDLHNVLVLTNKKAAIAQLPKKDLALYSVLYRQSPQVSLYAILHKIHPLSPYQLAHGPKDDHGKALPQLLVDWLDGTKEPAEIMTIINSSCHAHPEWFAYSCEKRMVIALSQLIFCPESVIRIHDLHPHATEMVKQCKAAGHKVYVLSNWDHQSFVLLRQKFTDFFDMFDGIGISGAMKASKPSPTIYKKLLDTHQLVPADCWFIDDQPINLRGAQEVGINTILCSKKTRLPLSLPDLKRVWQSLPHHAKVAA